MYIRTVRALVAHGTLAGTLVIAAASCTGDDGSTSPIVSDDALQPAGTATQVASTVDAAFATSPFESGDCSGRFRVVEFDHVVETRRPEATFEANGAGVALADLDDDGRTDVVLGNLDGPIRVYWNDGGLNFTEQTLASGRARAVQTVDADGDGDLDVTIAPGNAPPLVFENRLDVGDARTFRVQSLPGVTEPAYSMVWFDPDSDGDLDLAIGSYDIGLGRVVGGEYVSDGDHGVSYIERLADGAWRPERLAGLSHALAMTNVDLDDDGDDDLLVGNDLNVPDDIWMWHDGAWARQPNFFARTTANTMSYDVADVDGDGDQDLFATDMAPFDETNSDLWGELETEAPVEGVQRIENALLDLGDEGKDFAADAGLSASGWSWSGRLFDADHDGDLDAFVANGMVSSALFPFGDVDGIVEPNLAFQNDGAGRFEHAPEWGLGTMASGRGAALGDIDRDGDLDIALSTVGGPAQLLINELCSGSSIIVEPRGVDGDPDVIGAVVRVSSGGRLHERTVRSGIGYLSADEPIAHVGLGDSAALVRIEVVWPDGKVSVADGVEPGQRVVVTRAD